MRRPIAVTLAIIAGMLVAFTAYVWVGNWFTARAATSTPLFGGGTCLSNGESFTYVVQVAIGAVTDSPSRGARAEITAESLKVRKSPPPLDATDAGTDTIGCVIRKSDWPGTIVFRLDSALQGTALTPRGQTLLIRDYDTDHWQISASRGRFPIDVRWK